MPIVLTKETDIPDEFLKNGVPGMTGYQDGDLMVDKPTMIMPTDPYFALAVAEYLDSLDNGYAINAFCPGEGIKDNSCSPSGISKEAHDELTTIADKLSSDDRDEFLHGGCGHFAGMVSERLAALNVPHKVVAIRADNIYKEDGELHVVVEVGDKVYDAMGFSTKKEMMTRWEKGGELTKGDMGVEGADPKTARFETIPGDELKHEMQYEDKFNPKLREKFKATLNTFCATGPGGGIDPSCGKDGRKGELKLPPDPVFHPSTKFPNLVQENTSIVQAMKLLATSGNLEAVKNHPIPPSPKLQAYKDALVKVVEDHQASAMGGIAEDFKPIIPPPGHTTLDKLAKEKSGDSLTLPNPSDVKFIKDLPGSTHPKLVEDPSGKQWVKKDGPGPNQLRNEVSTDAAYRAAGALTPKSGIVETANGPVKFSEFIHGAQELGQWRKTASIADINAMHKEIGKNFVLDAVLANRDVIGEGSNNILIKDGVPYRIDNGGGLRYRAQGKLKDPAHGGVFGEKVLELQTMRDPTVNKETAGVFLHLTDKEIHNQIKDVLAKKDSIINAVSDSATKEMLSKRFDYLKEYAKNMGGATSVTPANIPASIFGGPTGTGQASPVNVPAKSIQAPVPVPKPSSVNPLHSGEGLALHVKAQLDKKGVQFTKADMAKFAHMNPGGVNSSTIHIPKPAINSKDPKDVQKAKVDAKQTAMVSAIKPELPPGTPINVHKSYISNIKLGVTKKFGEIGTFTTEEFKPTEAQKISSHELVGKLEKYLVPIESNATVEPKKSHPTYDEAAHAEWRKTLTQAEKYAVESWKGSSIAIRQAVETGKPSQHSAAFMSAITKSPPHTGITYRGVYDKNPHDPKQQYASQVFKQMQEIGVGNAWIDPSPHCMSQKPSVGATFSHGDLLMRIMTKTGRPIVMEDHHNGEEEITGMPNVHYKIKGLYTNVTVKHQHGDTKIKYVVDLEEI